MVAGELVLTGFLLTAPLWGPQYQDAGRYGSRALYKHYKIDKGLRRLEKRWFSPDVRKYGGTIISLTRAIHERRISYEFTF